MYGDFLYFMLIAAVTICFRSHDSFRANQNGERHIVINRDWKKLDGGKGRAGSFHEGFKKAQCHAGQLDDFVIQRLLYICGKRIKCGVAIVEHDNRIGAESG